MSGDPPSRQPELGSGGTPAVGNVLGFSLLFRDKKALLRLDRRPLGPGVQLSDYEAEIPDVTFPLQAPISAGVFRNRRCKALRLRLTIEHRTLAAWLSHRLVGYDAAGMLIDEVTLDLQGRPDPTLSACPCLYMEGRDRAGRFCWLMVALQAIPSDRYLRLRPVRTWLAGDVQLQPRQIWAAVVRRLAQRGPSQRDTIDTELHVDPTHDALLRPFVESGWKAPDLSFLSMTGLSISGRDLSLDLDGETGNGAAAPVPARVNLGAADPVAHQLDQLEQKLGAMRHSENPKAVLRDAGENFERLLELVTHHPPSRRAILRWMAETSRRHDPKRCLSAVRRWLRLAPNEQRARRLLIEQLAVSGDYAALAASLEAMRQLPHPPSKRARLDLALANIRLEKLDDVGAARDLLEPLEQRCEQESALAGLRVPVLLALARARTDTPTAAYETLERALTGVHQRRRRASMRLSLAERFVASGHPEAATKLVRTLLDDAEGDTGLIDAGIELMQRAGSHALLAELVQARLREASGDEAARLRRQLVSSLRATGPAGLTAALKETEAALRDEPEADDLLEMAARIAAEDGQLGVAAGFMQRLIANADDAARRTAWTVERARLLDRAGDPAAAWVAIRSLLDDAPADAGALELAVRLCPAEARDSLEPRLVETLGADAAASLFRDRAQTEDEPALERELLERAARHAADPRADLRALTELGDANDPGIWARLADACAAADDADGERSARIEQGLRALGREDAGAAAVALQRAAQLSTDDDPALAVARAMALARNDAAMQAAEILEAVAGREHELGPLADDDRLGIERTSGWIAWTAGRLFTESDDPNRAVPLLRAAIEAASDDAALVRPCAIKLGETLLRIGQRREAAEVFAGVADRVEGEHQARWLLRAARLVEPAQRVPWLERAAALLDDDPTVAEALLQAVQAAGDDERASELLRQRAQSAALPTDRRVEALRRLVDLRRGRRDAQAAAREDPELVDLYRELLELVPDDTDALLVVAQREAEDGHLRAAQRHWQAALSKLDVADPRGEVPALSLAGAALSDGRPQAAQRYLERVLSQDPQHPEALAMLGRAGAALGDPQLRLRAAEGRLALADEAGERARALLELSALYKARGSVAEALQRLAEARAEVEVGSPLHLEVAQAWLELARDQRTEPEHEAAARAELRHALARNLPPVELRTEALLWAERLGDPEKAIGLLEDGLADRPSHELLLSTLKQVCIEHDQADRYLAGLEHAIETLPGSDERDQLIVELATTAAELEDAERTLSAVDRLSAKAAASPEMLDLRDWAVHHLGREDEELRTIGDRLLERPDDPTSLARLERVVSNGAKRAERLLALVSEADEQVGRSLAARAVMTAAQTDELGLLVRAMRRAVDTGAEEAVAQAWALAETRARQAEDETAIADLVAVGDAAGLTDRARVLLDEALAELPGAPHLHRLLWVRAANVDGDPTAAFDRALQRIDRIADEHGLDARKRTALLTGVLDQLDRRRSAAVLSERAREAVDEPETFGALLSALEDRGLYPEVGRVLEHAAENARSVEQRVDARKRLAHLCADTLDDSEAAIGHLEAALEIAPTDPDLLLPLLDHYFAQRDLMRAIALTERVLEHVPMGDAAFAALAHRAADAAVAQGDHERATQILRRALQRLPEDGRTRSRLAELEAMANDPAHLVGILRTIAERQSGRARIEALEERARLLVDPLGRLDEAIEDLEAVVAEAPERTDCADLLGGLYTRRERWSGLVALLESQFPRQHGVKRCETLRRIAAIYRDHLFDLPRCEQALRLALDHLGADTSEPNLAEGLRRQLVSALEAQGRFVDLAIYLERALAPEIDGEVDSEGLHPDREALLVELARIYRDPLDDDVKAARIYERLERLGRLPDEGLAPLARWYHREKRHEDLVRILILRAQALREAGAIGRKAAVDQRIGELLEGPLGRPHEAAEYFLDAYLANPRANVGAGARARVLLSGTDAVANVRKRLLDRLPKLTLAHRPTLLTLLGDILAPHEEYEHEAEARYTEALALDAGHAPAREALGRLLARQGRLEAAVDPLIEAARHKDTPPERAAEDAAIAARALLELGRPGPAEQVLKQALQRAPDSQRALLELARLYERLDRTTEQAIVLENLAQLPLSSMLRAEVSYRSAMLLQSSFEDDPLSPAAERARAYLLEAVSADAKHVAARQTLLELSKRRLEWSVVAHMHYLAIRDLPPGPTRAQIHLDLAETYLAHLGDTESSLRNIESAVQQAPNDVVVAARSAKLAARMPEPRRAAERFERIAAGDNDLDDAARARLWLLSAELRMHDDDPAAAELASKRVLELSTAGDEVMAAASRNLEVLAADDDRELRQQKSGLLRLLETEEQAIERLHILDRLREIGRSLSDSELVEWASREQLGLVDSLEDVDVDLDAAGQALRDVFAERGDYAEVVQLYRKLADRARDPGRIAEMLTEAARFCWHGLRNARDSIALLQEALGHDHELEAAFALLAEITQASDDAELREDLYAELRGADPHKRSAALDLQVASLAESLGRYEEAMGMLRRLADAEDPSIRYRALMRLDAVLTRIGQPADRLGVLGRCLELAREHNAEDAAALASDLARVQRSLGDADGALRTCATGLQVEPDHRELVELSTELLADREAWGELTTSLERLAALTSDPEDQARILTRAARVRLDHDTTSPDPNVRSAAVREARRLLVQACELAPEIELPRTVLLPLAFSEGRWDEVLELAEPLRRLAGEDEEGLILAALAQAYRHGERSLAREIGYRHGIDATQRYLYPGLRQLLTQVATHGPLPRLDALLAAGAAMSGGRGPLAEGLRSWAAGRPVQAGLALGLARLAEADGDAELARSLYQISSFMAPQGPVPALADRLPLPMPPKDIDAAAVGPMERPSVLRGVLTKLRKHMAGIPERSALLEPPPTDTIRTRLTLADTVVEPWRRQLQLQLPIAWSRTPFAGNVGVRNGREPTILLGPGAEHTPLPELRFRLAAATGVIGMGLAIVFDPAGHELGDVLDALGQLANPAHEPTGSSAQHLADALASRGATSAILDAKQRASLMEELAHWLTTPGGIQQLHGELRRARILFATRLSGQLDGALQAVAYDMGLARDGRPDVVATLRTEEATWLLRALGLY